MARMTIRYYIFLLCICSTCCALDESKQNPVDIKNEAADGIKNNEVQNKKGDSIPQSNDEIKVIDEKKVSDVVAKHDSSKTLTIPSKILNISNPKSNSNSEIESGAVMRGIYVFVGITMLFLTYVAFKTCRKRNKSSVMIKKYGVRTRRTDVEMEPLPIDEDEEDETVFDLGHVNNR